MNVTEKIKQALTTVYGDIRLSRQIEYIICDIALICDKEGIDLSQAINRGMELYKEEK